MTSTSWLNSSIQSGFLCGNVSTGVVGGEDGGGSGGGDGLGTLGGGNLPIQEGEGVHVVRKQQYMGEGVQIKRVGLRVLQAYGGGDGGGRGGGGEGSGGAGGGVRGLLRMHGSLKSPPSLVIKNQLEVTDRSSIVVSE